MKNKLSIFRTSFLQVFMVAVNTVFLSRGQYIGVAVASFMISWLWVSNVKKANIASRADQFIYAFGAMSGGLMGLWITNLLFW
jgi:hypothetical protein